MGMNIRFTSIGREGSEGVCVCMCPLTCHTAMICPLVGVNSRRLVGATSGGFSSGLGLGLEVGLVVGLGVGLEMSPRTEVEVGMFGTLAVMAKLVVISSGADVAITEDVWVTDEVVKEEEEKGVVEEEEVEEEEEEGRGDGSSTSTPT